MNKNNTNGNTDWNGMSPEVSKITQVLRKRPDIERFIKLCEGLTPDQQQQALKLLRDNKAVTE